jgi:hypothetical protein
MKNIFVVFYFLVSSLSLFFSFFLFGPPKSSPFIIVACSKFELFVFHERKNLAKLAGHYLAG